jgi:hypothetical protein
LYEKTGDNARVHSQGATPVPSLVNANRLPRR